MDSLRAKVSLIEIKRGSVLIGKAYRIIFLISDGNLF